MNILEYLKTANSTRDFVADFIIPKKDLEQILETGRMTSSGGNIQPWNVTVVQSKQKLKNIGDTVGAVIKNKGNLNCDVQYYPTTWKKKYQQRRLQTGLSFYAVCGINRKDKEKRIQSWIDNFYFFNSQNVLFIHVDKIFTDSSTGMLIDIGMFIENILLEAGNLGYSHCVQGAIGEYAGYIKPLINIPDDHSLLLSITLGKKKENSKKNSFKPERIKIEEFTQFIVD